jgi:hypothetical protein
MMNNGNQVVEVRRTLGILAWKKAVILLFCGMQSKTKERRKRAIRGKKKKKRKVVSNKLSM